MVNGQSGKLTEWLAVRMISWQNGKLIELPVDKMVLATWLNGKFKNVK